MKLQGKLKYKPKGNLYGGAEVTDQMRLGLVSKGLCSILLKLVSQKIAGIHYSFGDSKGDEWAHIVFPAWTFFDKIVATKPGDTPPPMDEDFPESAKDSKKRKASGSNGNWNTEDTYSLSFNSMYLDLPTWHLMNLNVMKDVDLRQFWGDSMLRFVAYEKTGNLREKKHLRRDNKYLMGIQTQFLGATHEDGTHEKIESVDSLPWDKARPSITRSYQSYSDLAMATNDDIDDIEPEAKSSLMEEVILDTEENGSGDEDENSESSATLFFDAKESTQRSSIDDLDLESVGLVDDHSVLTVPLEVETRQSATIWETTRRADLLCPGWIDMCESKGKYTKVYAFTTENNSSTVFRTNSQFARSFATDDARALMDAHCSPRASSSEKLRRYMGSLLTQPKKNVKKFYKTKYDEMFLRWKTPSIPEVKSTTLFSCMVARALSERHWIEEWAVITSKHISFYHPEIKKPRFRISLRGFFGARKLSDENKPNFPNHHFLEIETLGRNVYLMFLAESQRDLWINVLSKVPSAAGGGRLENQLVNNPPLSAGSKSSLSKGIGMDSLLAFEDPSDEFLHKSTVWSCKQRRILNCRNFVFTSLGQAGVQSKTCQPNEVASEALQKVLEPMEHSEEANLRAFLDSASALKAVNVSDMPESERLPFFLNLYHIMVMHAFLVLGVPDSAFKWASFFNMISYQCSDEIFSLTELEHSIVRANMSSPSQFVAKFVLPKSDYDFALKRSDYRINFALNCGSLSNPKMVPVYRSETINEQLDATVRNYVKQSVKVKKNIGGGNVLVVLPRICYWYASDFGRGRAVDVVYLVKKYLDKNIQELLPDKLSEGDWFSTGAITVKYLHYNYQCRHLTLLQDSS
mmetsp:Transcript_47222/g.71426  ORF Transcript_47222/g.71426 Transcript_47222/m.71426 type:complete len:861 (+) Transcript_47222:24-2606(+)